MWMHVHLKKRRLKYAHTSARNVESKNMLWRSRSAIPTITIILRATYYYQTAAKKVLVPAENRALAQKLLGCFGSNGDERRRYFSKFTTARGSRSRSKRIPVHSGTLVGCWQAQNKFPRRCIVLWITNKFWSKSHWHAYVVSDNIDVCEY